MNTGITTSQTRTNGMRGTLIASGAVIAVLIVSYLIAVLIFR